MITAEKLAEIEARASAAKEQCICDACIPPDERIYSDDHEDLREFHNREDVPLLLEECRRLRAVLKIIAKQDKMTLLCDPADYDFNAEDAYSAGANNAFCNVAAIARDALNLKEQG